MYPLDRYTIVNRETGDVFACSENPDSSDGVGKFVGNCAAHRIVLYGTGWRQRLPTKKILQAEIENYINNAKLDPDWIGVEADLSILPDAVRRWVAQLASRGRAGDFSPASIVYMPRSSDDVLSASGR
jgi:hypothetical protein